jgi:hypothetical protein
MLLARASTTSTCWSILFRAYKLAGHLNAMQREEFKCSFIPQMMGLLDLFSPRLFTPFDMQHVIS